MIDTFWSAVEVMVACIAVAVPITIIYLAWDDAKRMRNDKK